jgi:hypothetical protein
MLYIIMYIGRVHLGHNPPETRLRMFGPNIRQQSTTCHRIATGDLIVIDRGRLIDLMTSHHHSAIECACDASTR